MKRLVVLAIGTAWIAAAGPKLEIEPRILDLGRQETQPKAMPMTFRLTNRGDAPLQITKVKSGCGCTQAEVSEKLLPPGGEATLTAVFEPGHREGPVMKSITIETDDPDRPRHHAQFKTVLPYSQTGLRLAPNYKEFPARLRDGKFLCPVGVENCDREGVRQVTKVEIPEGWSCETAIPLKLPPERRTFIYLTKPVEGEPEPFRGAPVTVHTDHPDHAELKTAMMYLPSRKTAANAAGAAKP